MIDARPQSMTLTKIAGNAFYCGDHVNTDVMCPGRFEPCESTEQLARIALIDYQGAVPFVDEQLGRSKFKIVIAGRDFGCGSSRETAPQALYYAGVRVVIAVSFARIFYRNCVNMGLLLPIRCAHGLDESVTGKTVEVCLASRQFTVEDQSWSFPDFGPLASIIEAGGLVAYTKQRLEAGI